MGIDDISPNNYNPNHMDSDMFNTLVNNIKRDGMLQPLLVRMDGTIIDGEHRWRASKEAGLTELECVVVESSDDEAQIQSIAFNNVRGVYEYDALAAVVASLSETHSVNDIVEQTGITQSSLSSLIASMQPPETTEYIPTIEESPPLATAPIGVLFGREPDFMDGTTHPDRGNSVNFKDPVQMFVDTQTKADPKDDSQYYIKFPLECTAVEIKTIKHAVNLFKKTNKIEKERMGTSIYSICARYINETEA